MPAKILRSQCELIILRTVISSSWINPQGTTPGNRKVAGSNLQSELIFRILNYEFYYQCHARYVAIFFHRELEGYDKNPKKASLFSASEHESDIDGMKSGAVAARHLPATQWCWDLGEFMLSRCSTWRIAPSRTLLTSPIFSPHPCINQQPEDCINHKP